MKSNVIFCAIALCFEFGASLPYSIDSQRYAGYQARPAQASFQGNAQRPYQYSNQQYNAGQYRTQDLQNQPQHLLPTVNRDQSLSRNQQRYLPKGPPQQIVQQNIPYNLQNRVQPAQIISQQHVPDALSVQQGVPVLPSQITNTVPFIPAVPLSSQVPPLGEEIEIPVIQPRPPRVERENIREVDHNRFWARAANPVPVEQIPQPRASHRPAVEQFLSHPKVRDALATAKHKKRYLVIHPDGTIEHVDKIENVALEYPNYHLVKAGDIVPNAYRENPSTITTITQLPPPPPQIHDAVQTTYVPKKPAIDAQIEKIATVKIVESKEEPKLIKIEEGKETPIDVKAEEIIQEPPSIATANIEVGSPNSDPLTSKSQNKPSDINAVKIISPPHVEIPVKDQTKPSAATAVAVSDSSYVTFVNDLLNEITIPVPPIIADSSLPKVPFNNILEGNAPDLLNKDSAIQTTLDDNTPLTLEEVLKMVQDELNVPVSDNIVAIANVNSDDIAIAHSDSSAKDHSDVTAEATAVANTNSSKQPDDNPPHVEANKPQENNISVAVAKANNENVIIEPDQEQPPKADINPAKPMSDKEFVTTFNKYMAGNTLFVNAPTPVKEARAVNDIDTSKALPKPEIFSTSDPDFWKKVTGKDEGVEAVYFFQIHNQPKVERDVRTTIHANGTIVEDTIEKYWAFEGDEPTITKSTKVTHPEDL